MSFTKIAAAGISSAGSFILQNVNSSGVSTFGNTVVGGGTTQLVVNGNARVTGILTIGTSSVTLDGTNNQVNVGTGVTIHHTNGVQVGINTLHSSGLTINQINVGTGASINSPSSNTLALGTNNTEAVRIDSSGRLGIGTTNPQQKLDVLGNILCNGTSGYALGASSGKYYYFDNLSGNNFIGLESTNTLGVYVGGNLGLRISSSGNVGIGSAVPVRLLDISQTNSTAYNADDFDQNYQVLRLRNATALRSVGIQFQVGTVGQAAITATETGDGSTALTFATRNGGVRSEKIRIAPNGSVGIGTTSIPSIVSIGSSRVADNVVVTLDRNPTGGYWAGLQFRQNGNQSWALFDDSSSPLGNLLFRAGSSNDRMVLYQSGILDLLNSSTGGVIIRSSSTATFADDATLTIGGGTNGAMLIAVYDTGSGYGGLWGSNYGSTTGVIYNGSNAVNADTDGNICVFKNINSHGTTIKNRLGVIRTFSIAIFATQAS